MTTPLLRRARTTARSVLVLLALMVVLAAGCGAPGSKSASVDAAASAVPIAPQVSPEVLASGAAADGSTASPGGVNAVDAPAASTGRKVVSTATMTVEADDLPAAKDRAAAVAGDVGGLVYAETSSYGARSSSVITLKVPPEAFDDVLRQLAGLGTLTKQDIKTEDVTQQVIDLDARVRSAEASVSSVQGFVGASTNLIETAQLENELQRRIVELESLRGQRQTLEKRVDMATIVLTLESRTGTPGAERDKAPAAPAPPAGFGDGLRGSLDLLGDLAQGAAIVGGALLPFLPFVVALALLVRWRRRRVAARRMATPPPSSPTGPIGPTGPLGPMGPLGPSGAPTVAGPVPPPSPV